MRLAGASVSAREHTAPNCAMFALGPFIGATPHAERTGVAEAFNRALVRCIRKRGDGRNEAVMTTLWVELLPDLGFWSVPHPIVGDLIVYTIRKEWVSAGRDAAGRDEMAVHFGILVEAAGGEDGLMVESKSGYAFHTYTHPLNVVDPTYLIEAPCIRVHFFRPPLNGPLPLDRLRAIAAEYTDRLRNEYGVA